MEVRATENSPFVSKLVRDLEVSVGEDVAVVGLIHRERGYGAPSSNQIIDVGDVFIIEVAPEDLRTFLTQTGFALEIFRDIRSDVVQTVESEDVTLLEAVVMRNGVAEGNSVRNMHLRSAFGVNLLGVSRRGNRLVTRVSQLVLLLQGRTEVVQAALPQLGLLPLAQRELGVGQRRPLLVLIAAFAAALLLIIFGVVPIHISLPGAVAVLLVSRFLSLHAAYQAVNWPIILLGAMIPVGEASPGNNRRSAPHRLNRNRPRRLTAPVEPGRGRPCHHDAPVRLDKQRHRRNPHGARRPRRRGSDLSVS